MHCLAGDSRSPPPSPSPSPSPSPGAVLVHCVAGVSRSASIVMGYLMWKHVAACFSEARSIVKAARPIINPNLGFVLQLRLFERAGCSWSGWEPWDLRSFLRHKAEMTPSQAQDDGTVQHACQPSSPRLSEAEGAEEVSGIEGAAGLGEARAPGADAGSVGGPLHGSTLHAGDVGVLRGSSAYAGEVASGGPLRGSSLLASVCGGSQGSSATTAMFLHERLMEEAERAGHARPSSQSDVSSSGSARSSATSPSLQQQLSSLAARHGAEMSSCAAGSSRSSGGGGAPQHLLSHSHLQEACSGHLRDPPLLPTSSVLPTLRVGVPPIILPQSHHAPTMSPYPYPSRDPSVESAGARDSASSGGSTGGRLSPAPALLLPASPLTPQIPVPGAVVSVRCDAIISCSPRWPDGCSAPRRLVSCSTPRLHDSGGSPMSPHQPADPQGQGQAAAFVVGGGPDAAGMGGVAFNPFSYSRPPNQARLHNSVGDPGGIHKQLLRAPEPEKQAAAALSPALGEGRVLRMLSPSTAASEAKLPLPLRKGDVGSGPGARAGLCSAGQADISHLLLAAFSQPAGAGVSASSHEVGAEVGGDEGGGGAGGRAMKGEEKVRGWEAGEWAMKGKKVGGGG